MLSTTLEYWAGWAPASSTEKGCPGPWSLPGKTHREDSYSLLFSIFFYPVYSCILWIRNFFNLYALLEKKFIKYPRRRKIPDFLLLLLSFLRSGSKIPHRRSPWVATQQTGWFTPTDCFGLPQVCFWGVLSICRWNWNQRVLISVLVLLFTSNLVLCTHLVLLERGMCAGVSAGNTLPMEGRVEGEADAPGCCWSCLQLLSTEEQEELRWVMMHYISPPLSRSVRIWCSLCECLRQAL